jgi:hypothetical protein
MVLFMAPGLVLGVLQNAILFMPVALMLCRLAGSQ